MKTEEALNPGRYDHMTNEERARLIHLAGLKQRYDNLTEDELVEYYELLFKAGKSITPTS